MERPMKRIAYAALATVSGLVLLLSYRTSTGAEIPTANAAAPAASTGASGSASGTGSNSGSESGTGSDTDSSDSESGSGSASGSDATGGTTGSSATTSSGLKDGTFTGDAASTRYGPVQVQVTVSGGRIASVDVVEYPNENPRDRQINQQAVPMLISETTSAQSAQIDMISGATYTSRGYQQSLQSALDQAKS